MRKKWTPASRLTVAGVGLLTLVAILLCAIAFAQAWFVLKGEAFGKLSALAAANRRELNSALGLYVQLVELGRQSGMATDLTAAMDSGGPTPQLIDSIRTSMIKATGVLPDAPRAEFMDAQGKVIMSTDKAREGTDLSKDPDFKAGRISSGILGMRREPGGIFIYVASPVLNNGGQLRAVLIEKYPASRILEVTGDHSGLGQTGENLIGQRVGDRIEFLTQRRFETELESPGPLPLSSGIAQPMVHATAGQTGVIIGMDYRGVTAVAAYAPLNVPGWGLVVKQDKSEVFSKVNRFGILLIISVILLAVAGAFIIVPLASALAYPIDDPGINTDPSDKPEVSG